MKFFTTPFRIRLTQDMVTQIENILENDKGEKYDSLSHFVRCALMENIRTEG